MLWRRGATTPVIVGKSVPRDGDDKYFGFVLNYDKKPKRRLASVLESQGMQMNQQMTFLSDGEDTVRNLQMYLNPQSEHLLDWFHITMRITVLGQYAKGVANVDFDVGRSLTKNLESIKWYLWHGNVYEATIAIEDFDERIDELTINYAKIAKFKKTFGEFRTYIENNRGLITNYGERWRYGELISTAFVESTVNAVVSKRFAKKQQMQWTCRGAHLLLQTRTRVLNGELAARFQKWYPGFGIKENAEPKIAA